MLSGGQGVKDLERVGKTPTLVAAGAPLQQIMGVSHLLYVNQGQKLKNLISSYFTNIRMLVLGIHFVKF